MEDFFATVKRFRPFILASKAPERERYQSPDDHKKMESVIRCILCACCTAACPVMSENPDYVGPAALVWAYRLVYDTRDEQHQQRLKEVDFKNGVWSCVNYFECTRVCPKGIPVTKSINTMKREIEKGRSKS
jgi:succinate dehydrogenase / fumarate reductase iron-sulfur subunit